MKRFWIVPCLYWGFGFIVSRYMIEIDFGPWIMGVDLQTETEVRGENDKKESE